MTSRFFVVAMILNCAVGCSVNRRPQRRDVNASFAASSNRKGKYHRSLAELRRAMKIRRATNSVAYWNEAVSAHDSADGAAGAAHTLTVSTSSLASLLGGSNRNPEVIGVGGGAPAGCKLIFGCYDKTGSGFYRPRLAPAPPICAAGEAAYHSILAKERPHFPTEAAWQAAIADAQ